MDGARKRLVVGVSTREGKRWREQRQFLINNLDNITGEESTSKDPFQRSVQVRVTEDVVLDEVADIKRDFAKKEGEALSLSYMINIRKPDR